MDSYHVFDTAHGFAAIGWRGKSVTALRLPSDTPSDADRALLRRLPGAIRSVPSADVAAVIAAAQRYFAGGETDFTATAVDLGEQTQFFRRVYDVVRALRWGESTTYGAVAKQLCVGPEFARDVGQAMANNPVPLIVPCHRVLAAGGKVGGFSAPGGSAAKMRMLALEGIVTVTDTHAPASSTQQSFAF